MSVLALAPDKIPATALETAESIASNEAMSMLPTVVFKFAKALEIEESITSNEPTSVSVVEISVAKALETAD